jgi:gamma-D-glutamyl-L-lysine dipeptidyl-peptidase
MKKFLFLFLLFTIVSFSQQGEQMDKVQNIIQQVKEKYAPDKRTAIFNVEANNENGNLVISGETNLIDAKNALNLSLKKEGINSQDKILMLPAEDLGDKVYGVIDLSTANIRGNRANQAELVTQALLGTPIKIYKLENDWYLIQTPDKYLGWTEGNSFRKMNKQEFEKWQNAAKVIFIKKYGTAFSEPNANSTPVSDLVMGNILIKLNAEGEFIKVKFPDQRVAYVPNASVEDFTKWLNNVDLTQRNVLSTAIQFMGTPYLWGGTSDKGFDCSGFTKTVFFMNGVILPRDASQQALTGEPVDTKDGFGNLQPGDLLFFGKKATPDSKEKVTHVGMYIGNSEFINSSGMVKINSLKKGTENFSDYRLQTFLKAKRIIGVKNLKGVTQINNSIYTSGIPDYNE